jgi:hypothetical protein
MRLAMNILLGIASAVIFVSVANAQAAKVIYELQERCGRRAAEVFKKDFPKDTTDATNIATYENHYNVRLNKCFLLETNTMYVREAGKTFTLKMLTLVDVNENKVYGSFNSLNCNVLGKKCRSEEEWLALIRPFMDE